jgi:hypothetical protein
MKSAFLRFSSLRFVIRGWHDTPMLAIFILLVAGVPQARAMLIAGMLGGIVIGAALILARHPLGPSGPRRGTPVMLFPRRVDVS